MDVSAVVVVVVVVVIKSHLPTACNLICHVACSDEPSSVLCTSCDFSGDATFVRIYAVFDC